MRRICPYGMGFSNGLICNAIFPHFPNKARALAEISRVLKNRGKLVICHTNSREAVNEIHRNIGGAVAHDTIPPDDEMRRWLLEAGLGEAVVRDEPDRYLVFACRNGRG